MPDPPPFLPDPQQKDGPIHQLAEGRYFATVDPDGVPRIYRADTAGAVLRVEGTGTLPSTRPHFEV